MDKFAGFYNDWLNAQMKMMKNWMDAGENLRKTFQGESIREKTKRSADWFEEWQNTQMKFFKEWADYVANLQKTFWGLGGAKTPESEAMKKAFDLHDSWMGIYNSWAGSMSKVFEEMMTSLSKGIGRETFANIFSSADTYMKLFEFWMPIYKTLQDRTFDPAAYQRLLDPARYKDVLNKVFDFISPFYRRR